MEIPIETLNQMQSAALDLGMKLGPKLAVAAVILAAGYFAASWAGRAVAGSLRRFEFEPPVRALFVYPIAVSGLLRTGEHGARLGLHVLEAAARQLARDARAFNQRLVN